MVTQKTVARLAGLHVSTVNKILNRRPGFSFSSHTIKKVFGIARSMNYDFGKPRHHHRRRFKRKKVSFETQILIYCEDGSLHYQGIAMIDSVSLSGALVRNLDVKTIPAGDARVVLKPTEKPLQGIEFRGRFVRLATDDEPGYGVEFIRPRSKAIRKLKRFAQP